MEKKYTLKELEQMASIVIKNTPASTTPAATTLHGPFHESTTQFGLFSGPGIRPQRFSTLARPWSLASILGFDRSRYYQEKLEVMTGVTAAAGSNASSFCGDPPAVGTGKVCKQIHNWGKYYVKTDLNVFMEIGQFRDRADVPAEILNAGAAANPLIPDIMYRMDDTQSQLQWEFWRIGVQFERVLDSMLVLGNNGTPTAPHGWFADFNGIDYQIRTGYTDADTGLTCPAMDSAVITYSANVNTTTADGRNIVQALGDLMYGLRQRASKFMMPDVQWVIVMREELFRSFIEQYSCLYNLYHCAGSQYEENNIDQVTTNNLRLEMLRGRYILVDGIPVPVVFSEGITQTTPASNTFESDMYVVPVSWAGMKLTRLEYFPADNQYITEFSDFQGINAVSMNNGMWLVGSEQTALCKEYHFQAKWRLIIETPFLAGRIDNLQYTFSAPIRNAIPGASYYADGGTSYRT